MSGLFVRAAIGFALILAAAPAAARTSIGGTPFASGLNEATLVVEHLAGLLALGAWAGQVGGQAAWSLPLAALAGAAVAAAAANFGVPLPHAGIGLAVVVTITGGLVAMAARPPAVAAIAAGAVFGVFHGYMDGGSILFWSGFGAGVLILLAGGLGLVAILGSGMSPRLVRVCGAGAAVAGIIDLASRF